MPTSPLHFHGRDALDWQPQAPEATELSDHAVPILGRALQGKQIALLVCGGIAAMKAPLLARALRKQGAEVTAFVSQEALRYVTPDALSWSCDRPIVQRLSARAEHLGDGVHYDAYLLAPASYNTINKIQAGVADGLLTTVLASALGRMERGECEVLVAPTLHGSMHNRILQNSLKALQELGVRLIAPREGYGKHNLPDEETLVFCTARALARSPLRGRPILVTGGPTAVRVDAIRQLSNRFSGQLGMEIAKALYLQGAEVHWVHGKSALQLPAWLPCTVIESFEAYQEAVQQILSTEHCHAAILSAAVADYRPSQVASGKLPSGGALQSIELEPTPKILRQVLHDFPQLPVISFKFEAQVSHAELMTIARQRLAAGSAAVVANRAEEQGDEQVAWLVSPTAEDCYRGKPHIAQAVVQFLARQFADPGSQKARSDA